MQYEHGGAASDLLPMRDVIASIATTVSLQERTGRFADLLRVKDA